MGQGNDSGSGSTDKEGEGKKKGLVLVTKGLKLVCSGQLKLLVCDRENAFFNSESSVQSDSFCTARLNV